MIIDYSTFRPSIQELRNARVTAAGRYIGWDSVPGYKSVGKNITKAEADLLTGSGISVFLSFEYAAAAAMLSWFLRPPVTECKRSRLALAYIADSVRLSVPERGALAGTDQPLGREAERRP